MSIIEDSPCFLFQCLGDLCFVIVAFPGHVLNVFSFFPCNLRHWNFLHSRCRMDF